MLILECSIRMYGVRVGKKSCVYSEEEIGHFRLGSRCVPKKKKKRSHTKEMPNEPNKYKRLKRYLYLEELKKDLFSFLSFCSFLIFFFLLHRDTLVWFVCLFSTIVSFCILVYSYLSYSDPSYISIKNRDLKLFFFFFSFLLYSKRLKRKEEGKRREKNKKRENCPCATNPPPAIIFTGDIIFFPSNLLSNPTWVFPPHFAHAKE